MTARVRRTSPMTRVETNNVVERLARALSIPQHHTGWEHLPEAEKNLFRMQADYALKELDYQSLSDRIDVLEGERAAAIDLCDTSVTQCPFSKDRAPSASRPCPKCEATSNEPCRKQVQAASEAMRMLKAASLTQGGK